MLLIGIAIVTIILFIYVSRTKIKDAVNQQVERSIDKFAKSITSHLELILAEVKRELAEILAASTDQINKNISAATNQVNATFTTTGASINKSFNVLSNDLDKTFRASQEDIEKTLNTVTDQLTATLERAVSETNKTLQNVSAEFGVTLQTINGEVGSSTDLFAKEAQKILTSGIASLELNVKTLLNEFPQIVADATRKLNFTDDALAQQLFGGSAKLNAYVYDKITEMIKLNISLLNGTTAKLIANADKMALFAIRVIFGTAIKIAAKQFGEVPLQCPDGWFQNGLFCSKMCEPGEQADGLGNCYSPCPSTWSSTLLTCNKPAPYGRSGRIPDKICPPGTGFDGVASCLKDYNIPPGWHRTAIATIQESNPPYSGFLGFPAVWTDLDRFGIHSAAQPGCKEGEEFDGFLCYPKCAPGYHPVGCCVCSPDCPVVDGVQYVDFGVGCVRPARFTESNRDILSAGVCPTGYIKSNLGTGCVKVPTFNAINLTYDEKCKEYTDILNYEDKLLEYQTAVKAGKCEKILTPIILDARGITYDDALATAHKYNLILADKSYLLANRTTIRNLAAPLGYYAWVAISDSPNEWLYMHFNDTYPHPFGADLITHSQAVGYKPAWGETRIVEGGFGRAFVLHS